MATNDRNNPQEDQNRQNQNRNQDQGTRGQSERTGSMTGSTGSQSTDWDKKSKDQQNRPGMEGKQGARTTNPSETGGFEANRDRNKYDDTEKSPDRDRSGSTGRESGL